MGWSELDELFVTQLLDTMASSLGIREKMVRAEAAAESAAEAAACCCLTGGVDWHTLTD
jgi:hypothetical protein